MRIIATLLLLTCIGKLSAQDLIIEYDFITDSYTFFQNGKAIPQPIIRKNYEVKVQVKNLNPFVFVARCNWKQQIADNNSSISGIAGMFKGIGGLGAFNSILSSLNMDQFEDATLRGGPSLLESNLNAKSSLQNAINAYNKLFEIEQTMNKVDFTSNKLKKLKLNPYLPSDTLKQIAHDLTYASLYTKKGKEPNLSATGFIQYASNLTVSLNAEYENLINYSNSFVSEYNKFISNNGNNFAEAGMDKTIATMVTAANTLKSKYTDDAINNKLESLEQQYEIITYTPFSYTCNFMPTGDLLSLTLDFFQISSGASNTGNVVYNTGDVTDTMRKIRTKSVNILVRGEMKISSSVGLGFPTYFNKNQTYSNRDSVISSAAGNNFAPCIATYINFYPYYGKNIHWGGTFGIGLPIQNEGTSSMNFFLGGSAVIGSSSKVVIHGGLAVGQLSMLSNGQKVGDKLGDKFTPPSTKKSFTTGAFFGISFALNK